MRVQGTMYSSGARSPRERVLLRVYLSAHCKVPYLRMRVVLRDMSIEVDCSVVKESILYDICWLFSKKMDLLMLT